MKKLSWVFRIVAALILLQTLYFKFTGHPESVELFTKLGVEPWGRISTGVLELITSILLLLPNTVFLGAFFGTGLMSGAIFSHMFIIGIESKGDGGQLFIMAIITMLCCLITCFIFKETAIKYLNQIKNK